VKTITPTLLETKNKLHTTGSWLVLVKFVYSGSVLWRLTNNVEDIVYGGNTYSAHALALSPVRETIRGDLPKQALVVYDPELSMVGTAHSNKGLSGGEVEVRYVFATGPTSWTDTGLVQYFTILSSTWDDRESALTFTIGVTSPLVKRFPRDRYIATICRHKFRGGFCRYSGGTLTANTIAFYHVDGGQDYIRLAPYAAYTDFGDGQHVQVSGSRYNNGEYVIDRVVYDTPTGYTRFYLHDDFELVNENSAHTRTITVEAVCDHSLTVCRANGNDAQYGGHPGVSEGLYG